MVPVAITAAAAITAVGGSAEETCASIRAGIKGFRRHAWFEAEGPEPGDPKEPLIAAPAPGMDPGREGAARLIDLLSPLLSALVRRAELEARDLAESALLLALPEQDEATATWGLDGVFIAALSNRSGVSAKRVITNRTGRAGMIELLGEAADLLAERSIQTVIVAGVDSYLSADRLSYLDRAQRIKSRRNADGFIPGEGASALVVRAASRSGPRSAPALAVVPAVGRGNEPQGFASDRQSTGMGLCQALRGALSGPAGWVLCDMNGESYRSFEWGLAMARIGSPVGGARLTHPAASHGDIGAAAGGVLAAAAIAGFSRGYAPAGDAVLYATSDGPARAAARVVRP